MKEKLLVLAKAMPDISKKWEHTVCVAGITENGEWRRIYPVPWKAFWTTAATRFSKKSWIEYELKDTKPSDHRPESRKIKFETIKPLGPAKYGEIEKLLNQRLTSIEEIETKGAKQESLGVVKPLKVYDFAPTTNTHYQELVTRKAQRDLLGNQAIKLDIPKYKYRYIFMDDKEGRVHETLCEDWEVGELYRKCEGYRKQGKYKDENEVHEKVKKKMMRGNDFNHVYFVVGSHFRFNTYMIVGVVYPKKSDFSGGSRDT